MTSARVARVEADAVRGVRAVVLRPGQPLEANVYPGDEEQDTAHFGVFADGAMFGAVSIFRQPPLGSEDADAWRIRGMAVLPERRGLGYGKLLLRACIDHVTRHKARLVWCNARTPAVSLYARAGFVVEGEEFELPGIGRHHLMKKKIDP
jgi:GNAT superfamily N-acetyltransferase